MRNGQRYGSLGRKRILVGAVSKKLKRTVAPVEYIPI